MTKQASIRSLLILLAFAFISLCAVEDTLAQPRLIHSYTNLGTHGSVHELKNGVAVFTLFESFEENGDLNGDGDTDDVVFHLYDFQGKEFTNLGISGGSHLFVGNGILFRQRGDDRLFHYRPETGTLTDLEHSGNGWSDRGDVFVVWTRESDEGADLNGDGDQEDFVLQVLDLTTPALRNLRVAVNRLEAVVDGDLVAFRVLEADQGEDLNGDGDMLDPVLHVFDGTTGVLTNVGLHVLRAAVQDDFVAFQVPEMGAMADLNGDGDLHDRILHVYDRTTETTTNLGIAEPPGHQPLVSGDVVYGLLSEEGGGLDANGDGDLDDNVLQVVHPRAGISLNVGVALGALPVHTTPERAFASVSEQDQGIVDLNGDGDKMDMVLAQIDSVTGEWFNLGIAAEIVSANQSDRVIANDRVLSFLVPEYGQAGIDLTGDGDTLDKVLHLYRLDREEIQNLGVGGIGIWPAPTGELILLSDNLVVFSIAESFHGSDLDGDGDAEDYVGAYYDLELNALRMLEGARGSSDMAEYQVSGDNIRVKGEATLLHDTVSYLSTSIQTSSLRQIEMEETNVAMGISEPGRIDLNGNGRFEDRVIGIGRLRAPWEGTVNAGSGEVTAVLQINGETRRVETPVRTPLTVRLEDPPAGPGRYVLWGWASLPTGPFALTHGGAVLGFAVLPTPLHPGSGPQPIICLRSSSLPKEVCMGANGRVGPAQTPVSLLRSNGFAHPVTLTLQAVMEDGFAGNPSGWSVSNAVTVRVVD